MSEPRFSARYLIAPCVPKDCQIRLISDHGRFRFDRRDLVLLALILFAGAARFAFYFCLAFLALELLR